MKCYIATVCLERNRWGSRKPSFAVSDWVPRFERDGFDGIELWENHFLAASDSERNRLVEVAAPLAIYNSYAKFDDNGGQAREQAADAVVRLGATAVKYNLGGDAASLDQYRKNLLAWADQLPEECRLLCECHEGSVLERAEDAARFFADLDPVRFGVVAHPMGSPERLTAWFEAVGQRLTHLHVQMRGEETDPEVAVNLAGLDACCGVVKRHGFVGSVAMEFTRGIGRDEELETLYANVCRDLAYCRAAFGMREGGRI